MTYQPPQPPYQPQPQYPPPAVPGPPPPAGWGPPPQPPGKRPGPLVWIIAAVGVVAALCLAGGVVAALSGGGDGKTLSGGGDGTTGAAVGETGKTVGGSGGPAPKPATKTPAAKATKAKQKGIGDKVRDGKFEFVVTKVDCTKTKVGNEFLNKTAQGRFCVVSVTVTNIGDEPRTFTGANQKAYAGKSEYTNDGTAELYLNSDAQTFLEDVNPGNTVKGKLVFDVPKATRLTSIELHDGFFSGGVTVSLA